MRLINPPARRFARAYRACLALLLLPMAAGTLNAQANSLPGSSVSGTPSAPIEHLLYFVVENVVKLADPGATTGVDESVLGRLRDTEIGVTAPGLWDSARKFMSHAEWNALHGDNSWQGDFWEEVGGEIDALGRRPSAPSSGPLQTEDWVFSTEQPWGLAVPATLIDAYGALDGSLFRLARSGKGALQTERFLSEKLLLRSLGQGDDPTSANVDVDAFAVDHAGNVFLSFRSTEWVNGTLVADDGVVCIPEIYVFYGPSGNIEQVDSDSATVVFDKPQTDAWVQHAELQNASGTSIKILEDLTGLSIDPQGGSFEPLQPIPGLPGGAPHLFFTGTRLGPMVLSTRNGGELAQLNSQPLGAHVLSGTALGLDAATTQTSASDLSALHVETARQGVPLIDIDNGELHFFYNPEAVLLLDGFVPDSWIWMMFDARLPYYGEAWEAQPYAGPGSSQRLVWGQGLQFALHADSQGRARLVLPPAGVVHESFWVMIQALEVGSQRLSRPAPLWCSHGGALAGTPFPY